MGKGKHYIALLLFISLFACVKDPQDIPGDGMSDPVFGFTGSFGNTPLNIEAGADDWTILPIVEQSDSNTVYTSIFSKSGCIYNCSPSLEFKFYQSFPASGNDQQDFEQTIHTGEKKYVKSDLEQDSFMILLSTHPGLFMSGFSSWHDFNVPGTFFDTEYSSTIGFEENLNVCFESHANTGCEYTQCIYFDPATLIPCLISIEPRIESDQHISLTVRLQGTPPFNIQWFDSTSNSNIILPYQDSITEFYVSVRVTDALGNMSELRQSIRLQNGYVDACYFPINLTSTLINNSTAGSLSDKVEIIYRDENGAEWKSTGGVQDADASMLITSVNPFGLSPFNESAYLTNLIFSAKLYKTTTGEARVLSSQNANVALSHR